MEHTPPLTSSMFFFVMPQLPPTSTLFPYTTLFRSHCCRRLSALRHQPNATGDAGSATGVVHLAGPDIARWAHVLSHLRRGGWQAPQPPARGVGRLIRISQVSSDGIRHRDSVGRSQNGVLPRGMRTMTCSWPIAFLMVVAIAWSLG